jgi:perosamine synthetase
VLAVARDPRPRLCHLLLREYRADHAILCGSGTEALRLAIEWARGGPGGNAVVALPSYTCYDVATAAVGAGAPLDIYDVDPRTLAPDLATLEEALARGARVVVVSPLFGIPVPWDALEALVRRYGGILVEDAAQGHGAEWRGRPVGSFGDASVLSFGRGKGWSGGRGGALLLRAGQGHPNELPAPRLPNELLALGLAVAQWALGRPALYALPASLPFLGLGRTRYRPPRPARGMTRVAAELLLRTRARARAEADARRVNGEAWTQALGRGWRAALLPAPPPDARPGFLRFPLRLPEGLAGLAEPRRALRAGIAAGYPAPIPSLPAVRDRLVRPARRWPGGESLARELVTLPTHSRLSDRSREAILELLHRYRRP